MSQQQLLNEEFSNKASILAKRCANEYIVRFRENLNKGNGSDPINAPLLVDFAKLFESDDGDLKNLLRTYSIVDVVAEHLAALKKLADEEAKTLSKPAKNIEFESLTDKDIMELKNSKREDYEKKIKTENDSRSQTQTELENIYDVLFSVLDTNIDRLVVNHASRDNPTRGIKRNAQEEELPTAPEPSSTKKASEGGKKRASAGDKKRESTSKNGVPSAPQTAPSEGKKPGILASETKESTGTSASSIVNTFYDHRGKVVFANIFTNNALFESDAEKFKILPTFLMQLLTHNQSIARVDPLLRLSRTTVTVSEALRKFIEELIEKSVISEASSVCWEKLWIVATRCGPALENIIETSITTDEVGMSSSCLKKTLCVSDKIKLESLLLPNEVSLPENVEVRESRISNEMLVYYREESDDAKKPCARATSTVVNECWSSLQERTNYVESNLQELRKVAYDSFCNVWEAALQSYLLNADQPLTLSNGITLSSNSKIDRSIFESLPPSVARIVNPFDGPQDCEQWDWISSFQTVLRKIIDFASDPSAVVDTNSFYHPFISKDSMWYGKIALGRTLPPQFINELSGKNIDELKLLVENKKSLGVSASLNSQSTDALDTLECNQSVSSHCEMYSELLQKAIYLLELGHNVVFVDKTFSCEGSREKNVLHKCNVAGDILLHCLTPLLGAESMGHSDSTEDDSVAMNSNTVAFTPSKRRKGVVSSSLASLGPIMIVTRVSDLFLWEKYLLDHFGNSWEVVMYYGSENDRGFIREFLQPENLYTRQGCCHILLTHYEAVLVDLHHLKEIHFQQIVWDEPWGLHSRHNRYGEVSNAIQSMKFRNSIFLSSGLQTNSSAYGINSNNEIKKCLPDLFSALSLILPEACDVFQNENISQLVQDQKMFKYIRRILAAFTVVLDEEVFNNRISSQSKECIEYICKQTGIDSKSTNFSCLLSDIFAWMEWNGIQRSVDGDGTIECEAFRTLYTDDFIDEELDAELEMVNIEAVGQEGDNWKRTYYSASVYSEKNIRSKPAASGKKSASETCKSPRKPSESAKKGSAGRTSSAGAKNSKQSRSKNPTNGASTGASGTMSSSSSNLSLLELQSDNASIQKSNSSLDVCSSVEQSDIAGELDEGDYEDDVLDSQEPVQKKARLDFGEYEDEYPNSSISPTPSSVSLSASVENEEDMSIECESSSGVELKETDAVTKDDDVSVPTNMAVKDDMDSDKDEDEDDDDMMDVDLDDMGSGKRKRDENDDTPKARTYTRISSLPQNEEKLKSIVRKGAYWYAFISVPGRQRFLGIFNNELASANAFDEAYKQRSLELEWIAELKKKKASTKNESMTTRESILGEKKRGPKRGDEAVEHADKQWENKLITAKRKSRSKNSTRADIDDLLFMLDEDLILDEIGDMLAPQLASGKSLLDWVSCAENPPISLALLLGPQDFSALMISQRCYFGRARPQTMSLVDRFGLKEHEEACGESGACGAELDFNFDHGETIHMGEDSSIDYRHAVVNWCVEKNLFEIECLSSLGMFVNGKILTPSQGKIPLVSRSIVQIGSRIFYFLLPLSTSSNLTLTPLQQRCHLVRAFLAYLEYRDGPILSSKYQRPKCLSITLENTNEIIPNSEITVNTLNYLQVMQFQDTALSGGYKFPSSSVSKKNVQMSTNSNLTMGYNSNSSTGINYSSVSPMLPKHQLESFPMKMNSSNGASASTLSSLPIGSSSLSSPSLPHLFGSSVPSSNLTASGSPSNLAFIRNNLISQQNASGKNLSEMAMMTSFSSFSSPLTSSSTPRSQGLSGLPPSSFHLTKSGVLVNQQAGISSFSSPTSSKAASRDDKDSL